MAPQVVEGMPSDDPAGADPDAPLPATAVTKQEPAASAPRLTDALEIEVTKLRSIVTLQERLLDLRDSQLKDLKEEREWLRSRIERLDEKSDRDQLLLLSETQTIRKLVTNSQSNRTGFRAALEWLGVLEPQNNTGNSPLIELNR